MNINKAKWPYHKDMMAGVRTTDRVNRIVPVTQWLAPVIPCKKTWGLAGGAARTKEAFAGAFEPAKRLRLFEPSNYAIRIII